MNILPDTSSALASLRASIDELDTRLLRLLARRRDIVQQIGRQKTSVASLPAYERLLPMLQARAEQANELGLDADFIVELFQRIAHQALAEQRQQKLAESATSGVHHAQLPLVYSCSGCSSSAQLANDLALALDREQQAEMSCIAGVGGDVPALLKLAQSGRPVLVLDGCSRHCAAKCLQRHGVSQVQHVVLSRHGIKKHLHEHYRAEEFLRAKRIVVAQVQQMNGSAPAQHVSTSSESA